MATKAESPKESRPFRVNYTYPGPNAKLRSASIILPATDATDARQRASAHLLAEYQYFTITKIVPYATEIQHGLSL